MMDQEANVMHKQYSQNDMKAAEDRLASNLAKCRTFTVGKGKLAINLNPVVTIASIILIWGFVIWAVLYEGAQVELKTAQNWVTDVWTWLYIGTQDFWAVFIVYIYCTKYGKMKLGKDHEEPEYSDPSYFVMLFAAGVGIGLMYFGVAEPVYHYAPGHFGNRYYHRYSNNTQAQDAITLTFFHWGIHGWIVYVLVGLLLGFIAHRHDLPMTMRSCFYPLLGDAMWGTAGDIIDTLSVVCTMFGVCTSLGLGVIQLNGGLTRLNSGIPNNTITQIIIIWIITAMATVSVVTGVKVGIRRLSEVCFGIGCMLLFVVLFHDETWFLINLLTQSIGEYIQWIIQLGFHTDAFAQIGGAPDGKEAVTWMDGWTMFYWGWWIAWSPFVGMFIAKISRGRTIRQFIHYTLTVPILYVFLWFSVFGGAGLRMERLAEVAGIGCNDVLGGKFSLEPAAGNIYRLSCRNTTDMFFDVVSQYEGIGTFMSILSMCAIILYFVTSSDSGSLIIDCLTANGMEEPPVIQRIFWALTEGACATALLVAGGTKALNALQSVSIIAGLFYTLILNFMCVALWRSFKIECGEVDPNGPHWIMGLLDPFIRFMYFIGKENNEYGGKGLRHNAVRLLIAVVAPWYPMGKTAARLAGSNKPWIYFIVIGIPFYLWFFLLAFSPLNPGIAYVGWAVLMFFFCYGCGIRSEVRTKYQLVWGNIIEDFFAFMLLYPCAAMQVDVQTESAKVPHPAGFKIAPTGGPTTIRLDDNSKMA